MPRPSPGVTVCFICASELRGEDASSEKGGEEPSEVRCVRDDPAGRPGKVWVYALVVEIGEPASRWQLGVTQSERPQDALLELLRERLPGDPFDDQA